MALEKLKVYQGKGALATNKGALATGPGALATGLAVYSGHYV